MSKHEKETWGPVEVIIDQAWDLWSVDQENQVTTPSLPKRVADALRKAGLLRER